MCDKAILENGRTLEYFPDCYKNQQICDINNMCNKQICPWLLYDSRNVW